MPAAAAATAAGGQESGPLIGRGGQEEDEHRRDGGAEVGLRGGMRGRTGWLLVQRQTRRHRRQGITGHRSGAEGERPLQSQRHPPLPLPPPLSPPAPSLTRPPSLPRRQKGNRPAVAAGGGVRVGRSSTDVRRRRRSPQCRTQRDRRVLSHSVAAAWSLAAPCWDPEHERSLGLSLPRRMKVPRSMRQWHFHTCAFSRSNAKKTPDVPLHGPTSFCVTLTLSPLECAAARSPSPPIAGSA